MNKDQVKGKIDEVVGAAKRKTGEWTGNASIEIKGTDQEIRGKVETAAGDAKAGLDKARLDVANHVKSALNDAKTVAKDLTRS